MKSAYLKIAYVKVKVKVFSDTIKKCLYTNITLLKVA